MICFCGGHIETHKDRAMCMDCGTLTIVEPDCSAPMATTRRAGVSSSLPSPAGAFLPIPRGWQVCADAATGATPHTGPGRSPEQWSMTHEDHNEAR